jgi:hypothetical protein
MSNTTNPVPHRWAEVIHAFADGQQIQHCYLEGEKWSGWLDSKIADLVHLNSPYYKWRIKPQTKTGWICLYHNTLGQHLATEYIFDTQKQARTHAKQAPKEWPVIAVIQITYTEGEGLE